jgi:DNA invertase Pin-like site-specific DNA recombinase
MNRDTFPGTNPHACTSMLADDIADRIALAGHPAELDGIVKEVWGHHFAGALAENEAETLDEAARARREAIQARRQAARPGPVRRPGNAPWGRARRRQRSPNRQASIERRRRLVASGPLPPPLAARFTWGEIAVMRIVGDECRAHGCCTLHIDAIAARAGVHRTTVQNALREAQGREGHPGIITVQERRRRGQRSLTNIIRIINNEWLNWLHKGPSRSAMGVGSKCTAIKKSNTTDTALSLGGKPPWGIPDGVCSCEEVP